MRLVITGIIRPVHPAADFWTDDPAVARPTLIAGTSSRPAHWAGALFIGAGGLPLVVSGLNDSLMLLTWVVPADLGRLTADQASAVQAGINGLASSGLVIASGGTAPPAGNQGSSPGSQTCPTTNCHVPVRGSRRSR